MTLTVNTKAYNLDATVDKDANRYTGPNHTLAADDTLLARRSKSAATATSPGFARSTLRFQRSVTIGDKVFLATGEANFTIPVGMAEADVDALRDDLGDALLSAAADDLVWKHDINF